MSNAVFMRPLPISIYQASNTLAGYAAANMANDHLGVVWKAQQADASFYWFTVDLGSDQPIDTIAMLGLTGATNDWQMYAICATDAQGPTFGAGLYYSYPLVQLCAGGASIPSGRRRSYWEKPAGGPAAARYWRIHITTPANNTAITVGRLAIGKRIQLQHNFDFGGAFGVRDTGKVDWSTRAVFLRRRGVKLRTTGISFNRMYKDEVETTVQPVLELLGNTGPIFLLTDPDAHYQRETRMYFGPMIGELGTVWAQANGGHQWQCNIVDLEQIVGDA